MTNFLILFVNIFAELFVKMRFKGMRILQISKNLKNASTLAIGDVDTAESGPSKVRQVANKAHQSPQHRLGFRLAAPVCANTVLILHSIEPDVSVLL